MMPQPITKTKKDRRERTQGALRVMPLYVPSNTFDHDILPGSAIVGDFDSKVGRIMLDFEGNKYGWDNLHRYVERAMHAWDRHVQRYPTISRMYVQAHEVVIVGEYDPLNKRIVIHPLDMPKVEQWLGMSPIPESELVL